VAVDEPSAFEGGALDLAAQFTSFKRARDEEESEEKSSVSAKSQRSSAEHPASSAVLTEVKQAEHPDVSAATETDAAQAHAEKVVKLAVQRALANPGAAAVKPATTKPTSVKPATTKPTSVKPATTKPAAVKPATTKPAECRKWPKNTLQFGRPGQAAYIQQIPCDDPIIELTSTNIMSTKVARKGYSLFARRVKTEFENVIACTVEVEETSLPFEL